MQVDSSTVPSGTRLDTEVAIVGAGPAGIVTALELAERGHRVMLIESGGAAFDAAVQSLGEAAGHDPLHAPMSMTTRRQIGGASNLWGGRCVPFDPVDFLQRDIVGDASWPVGYEEIAAYFQRACDWCICGDAVFDAKQLADLASRSLIPGFPDGRVTASSLERWSLPTNFGREYHSAIERSDLVTLITNLTCTEIVCAASGRQVEHLRARTLAGKTVTVNAAHYVLACGGLETTRLLFVSDRHHPGGLGNHSGQLGRWYMAHVESRIAEIHFTTPPADTIYGHERDSAGVYVRRRLTFSSDFLIEQRLPNMAMWLVNPELSDPEHGNGVLSFVYLMLVSPFGKLFVAEGIRQAHIKASGRVSIARHLLNVVRNLGHATRFAVAFGYKRYLRQGRKVPGFFVPSAANVYPLMYHGEHIPHYESYVEPTPSSDALGMARLRTHLCFTEEDIHSIILAHRHLDEYLREHGLGHLVYRYDDLESAIREQLSGGYHQAGTTRMSTRPEDGVVDRDLAVHGVDELSIASSSTFVTSGQANSTFMIIAFALRLVDHIHGKLGSAISDAPASSRPANAEEPVEVRK